MLLHLLLQAIHRYQRLTELLQGKHPQQLLPPTPQGYILTRVRALAEGPCMTAFTWNSGSSWGHKPWTNELPNDSTLVFFLFAAFLEVIAELALQLVIVGQHCWHGGCLCVIADCAMGHLEVSHAWFCLIATTSLSSLLCFYA